MSFEDKKEFKLFIGGLHLSTTTESLREYYSQWGELVDAVVMRDPNTKRSRGFGFVTFADEESMTRCMDQRPHNVDGREVEAKLAVPREESSGGGGGGSNSSAPPSQQQGLRTKKVFLGGLHLDTTSDEVTEMLSQYGRVEEVTIKTDPDTEKPRGFGFAIFDNFDSVDKLCSERYVRIHDRDVEVKKAQSAEEMRRRDGPGGRHGGGHGGGRGHGGGYGQGAGAGRMAGYGGMDQYPYGASRGYPANYMPDYYRGADPYSMAMNPGYAAAAAYGGDRTGMYAATAAAGYRNPYEGAATAPGVAAYGMYGSYGGATSGYGPMRGYGGGNAGGGAPDQNGASYGGRNTGGRVYHPYKR